MNRYQQEVADMDRRHRLVVRGLSFAGAACLAVVVLWGAGLPPTQWLSAAQEWLSQYTDHVDQGEPSPHTAPPTSPVAAPNTPVNAAEALQGTDSSVSSAPQRLFVVSTSPGGNKDEGTAQIGTNPANPQTYVAGAVLANGARLAEIHADRVVLHRADERLTLYISSDRGTALARSTAGASDLGMVGGASAIEPRQENFAEDHLAAVIRAMPYYEHDLLKGLRIFPGKESGAFAQLGLKSGDVIIAIDGAPIADPQSSIELLQTLTAGAAMSVTVTRDNSTATLGLDGEVAAKAVARREERLPDAMLAGPP